MDIDYEIVIRNVGVAGFARWAPIRHKFRIGAHSERETPVPMPNTEVKPLSGYNTWVIKPWENSTVPNYIESLRKEAFYFGIVPFSSPLYNSYMKKITLRRSIVLIIAVTTLIGCFTTLYMNILFLVQLLVLISLSIFAIWKKKDGLIWYAAIVTCVAIIAFAFYMRNFGPRVVAEADGPASANYYCMYQGLETYNGNLEKHLCTLLFMPTSTANGVIVLSNRSLVWSSDNVELYNFLALQSFLALSLAVSLVIERKLANKY